MIFLDLTAEQPDCDTQRLYSVCGFYIIVFKCMNSQLHDLLHCFDQHLRFLLRICRKLNILLTDFLCHSGNPTGMIGNPLKITDRMQELCTLSGLLLVLLCRRDTHQISSKLIFIFIDDLFFILDLIISFCCILLHQMQGTHDVFLCTCCHSVHNGMHLCKCKLRIAQETFLEQVKICLIFHLVICLFDQPEYQLVDLFDKRCQNQYRHNTVYRI